MTQLGRQVSVYVVYHEVPKATEHAHLVYDGLFLVKASSPEEARHFVSSQLGDAFHGCAVEKIAEDNKTGVLVEFWRQTPVRSPRVIPQAVAA